MAYQTGNVEIQAPIFVRRTNEFNGVPYTSRVKTTVGKIIFNCGIPQNMGFVDRTKKKMLITMKLILLLTRKD